VLISSHRKLLSPKVILVSVAETTAQRTPTLDPREEPGA
jgi:hypothetical protein